MVSIPFRRSVNVVGYVQSDTAVKLMVVMSRFMYSSFVFIRSRPFQYIGVGVVGQFNCCRLPFIVKYLLLGAKADAVLQSIGTNTTGAIMTKVHEWKYLYIRIVQRFRLSYSFHFLSQNTLVGRNLKVSSVKLSSLVLLLLL